MNKTRAKQSFPSHFHVQHGRSCHVKTIHRTKSIAHQAKSWDRNRSSGFWYLLGLNWGKFPNGLLGLFMLLLALLLLLLVPSVNPAPPNEVARKLKGKAPIPNDRVNPSPNPSPPRLGCLSGVGLCPWGRGGVLLLGSSLLPPRPYTGIMFSLLIPALHTGHREPSVLIWSFPTSNQRCRQGQQNRCPHKLMTASRAVSRQMLHSKLSVVSPGGGPVPPVLDSDSVMVRGGWYKFSGYIFRVTKKIFR